MYKSNFPTCGRAGQKSRMEFLQQRHGELPHDAEDCLMTVARIFDELLSRDHEDGCATWQPQGVGSEAYLNGTSQGSTPEDARKDGHIRGRSK